MSLRISLVTAAGEKPMKGQRHVEVFRKWRSPKSAAPGRWKRFILTLTDYHPWL
jgi:hypothetical protein